MAAKKLDGAIIDLQGVSKRSRELLVHGEAIDIDVLKTLPKLETLDVYKIPARHVSKLERLPELGLKNLSLRFWGLPDLTAFRPPRGLQVLTVWQSNKLVRLDGIEAAPSIEILALNDNGPLESLAPLKALPSLGELYLTGGIWSKQKAMGLDALAQLESLRYLRLHGLDSKGLDLTPVTQIPNLQQLDMWARDYPIEQVAKVAAAYPEYLKDLLDLKDSGFPCEKCGTATKLLFLRGRKAFWCPICRKQGIERLINLFLEEVEKARVAALRVREPGSKNQFPES